MFSLVSMSQIRNGNGKSVGVFLLTFLLFFFSVSAFQLLIVQQGDATFGTTSQLIGLGTAFEIGVSDLLVVESNHLSLGSACFV